LEWILREKLIPGPWKNKRTRPLKISVICFRKAEDDFQHVGKVTLYLKNIADFVLAYKIYSEYFREPYPARETVEVCRLPKNVKNEISVIYRIP